MKASLKSVGGGVATLAIAGGLLFAGATAASAATPPSYEPDSFSAGALTLYDAAGNVETSGSINDHPFATYFAGSGGATAGSTAPGNLKAVARAYTPSDGVAPPLWPNDTLTAGTSYGAAASASYPGVLQNSTNAIAVGAATDFSLADYLDEFPSTSATNANIFSIRVSTGDVNSYYNLDIKVDPTSGTWTQIYPTPAATTSVAAITANPVSPAAHGSSVALTSTVSVSDGTHPTGAVELFDGATDVGPATFTAATGAITKTVSPTDGDHSYKYVFTPTTGTAASSAVLSYHVNPAGPADNTSTVLSGATTGTVGSPVTVTATVSDTTTPATNPAGKVQFSVDGAPAGAPVTVAAGVASFQYTPADTTAHTITGAFTATNAALFNPSSDSTGVSVTASAPLYAADPQTVDVNVPAGTLVISTPYTATNPLHLGDLNLNATGTSLDTVPVTFGDPTAAAAADPGQNASVTNGVTITDTRAGSTGWTASAQTSDFTNTGATPIDGDKLAFTAVTPKYLVGNNITSVTTNDITAFKTAKKSFATTTQGPGTVNITGKLALVNVPTSTLPGLYTATVTFTIV